jgi:hypothetical protein
MKRYVLKRVEDGKYVARPGSEHSYTNRLERAKIFTSWERAYDAKCDNERVVPLDSLLGVD